MRTEYVRHTPGSNLYAKPSPLVTSPWSSGVISATPNGSTGEYSLSLDESTNYTVFVRAGGSPASSDIAIAQIGAAQPVDASAIADLVIAGLDSVEITRISPYNPLTSAFVLIQDDDYIHENGTHVDIDLVETSINLSTATATVTAKAKLASNCAGFSGRASIVTGSPNKLRIEWPNAGNGQPIGDYIWQAKIVDSATNKKTHFEGPLTLKRSSDA